MKNRNYGLSLQYILNRNIQVYQTGCGALIFTLLEWILLKPLSNIQVHRRRNGTFYYSKAIAGNTILTAIHCSTSQWTVYTLSHWSSYVLFFNQMTFISSIMPLVVSSIHELTPKTMVQAHIIYLHNKCPRWGILSHLVFCLYADTYFRERGRTSFVW